MVEQTRVWPTARGFDLTGGLLVKPAPAGGDGIAQLAPTEIGVESMAPA